jgi:glutaredoxin
MAMSRLPHLTILSREDCHLCETARQIARRLRTEFQFSLSYKNIETDPEWSARQTVEVPVVLIDGREVCSGAMTEERLRRVMKRARWRRPISRILSRFGLTPKQ